MFQVEKIRPDLDAKTGGVVGVLVGRENTGRTYTLARQDQKFAVEIQRKNIAIIAPKCSVELTPLSGCMSRKRTVIPTVGPWASLECDLFLIKPQGLARVSQTGNPSETYHVENLSHLLS